MAKLSKEYLVGQRRESVFELVKAQAKAEEAEAQYQETIRELKRTLEGWKCRCQDVADDAEEQVQRRTAVPSHRYHTRSRTRNMEQAIDDLEQQNMELRAEMG
ncbi:hypothetical protein CR513_03563, partial [Mucuna pruriens]